MTSLLFSLHDNARKDAEAGTGYESGSLPLRKGLDLAVQIGDGLAKAHGAGIVQRDLKPENVMVSKGGFAKILDFGLAKPTPGGRETPDPPGALTPGRSR